MCLCLIKVRFVLTVEALYVCGGVGGVEGKLTNLCEDKKTTILKKKIKKIEIRF